MTQTLGVDNTTSSRQSAAIPPDIRAYESCLGKMRRGWMDFADALVEIHQRKLYLAAGIKTWAEFCDQVLRQSIRKTQRQIAAANLMGRIAAVDSTAPLPVTEGAARPLAGLAPDTAAKVLHAASTGGEPPTAAAINQAKSVQFGRPELRMLGHGSGDSSPMGFTPTARCLWMHGDRHAPEDADVCTLPRGHDGDHHWVAPLYHDTDGEI